MALESVLDLPKEEKLELLERDPRVSFSFAEEGGEPKAATEDRCCRALAGGTSKLTI